MNPGELIDQLKPLLNQRQVIVFGEINAQKEELWSSLILFLDAMDNKEPITIFINSGGGRTDPTFWFSDVIKNCKAPVHGLVTGSAYSGAFKILQSCKRRLAYPNASLLFHRFRMREYIVDDEKWDEKFRLLRLKYEEELKNIAEKTNRSVEEIRKWAKEERVFTAQEAKGLTLIDEIISSPYTPTKGGGQ